MRCIIIFVLLSVSVIVSAQERSVVADIESYFSENSFVTELALAFPIDTQSIKIDYINQTIQVDVPNGYIEEGKKSISIDKNNIRSVFMYQVNPETLRIRVILNGMEATQFKDLVGVSFEGGKLKVVIDSIQKFSNQAVALPVKKQVETEKINREEFDVVNGLENLESQYNIVPHGLVEKKQVQKAEIKDEETMSSNKDIDESKIPVLNASLKKSSSDQNYLQKMVLSLIIVVFTGILLFWVISRWIKNKKPELSNTKIRILTQYHLGPKKSLAIVSVAGESLLIGITDQNISMLKSLALLDEEIPELASPNFGKEMLKNQKEDDADQNRQSLGALSSFDQDDLDEEYSMKGIKEFVKSRLNGMRNL